jgi:hypothetical protein
MIGWARRRARMENMGNEYKIMIGKPIGTRTVSKSGAD